MSNRSKIALVVCVAIWLASLLFSVCAFRVTGGYSIYSLVLLPFSLLIYLGNYFDDDESCEIRKQKKISKQIKTKDIKIGEEKEKTKQT